MLRVNPYGNSGGGNTNTNAQQDQAPADQQPRPAAQAQPHPAARSDAQIQPGAPGAGLNFNGPMNPLFMPPHRGEFLQEMPRNRPLNQMLMQLHPDAPEVLGHMMPPGVESPAQVPREVREFTPAEMEFAELLSGPESAAFTRIYLEPSQRFSNDTETGQTALMLAAQAGDEVAVAALLSKTILNRRPTDGVIENYDYFIRCDERERRGIDRAIPLLGADYVDIRKPESLPLSAAAAEVFPSLVLDVRASDGRSPLMFAAQGGNVAVAEKLLAKGADIHAHADDGRTALAIAVDHGRADMVNFLIQAGALRSVNQSMETAIEAIGFSSAANKGYIEVVRTLLDEIPALTACRNARLARQLTENIYPFPAVNEMLIEARANEEKMLAAAMDENLQSFNDFIEGKSVDWLNSALRTACGLGLANAIEPLVRGGANVNAKTRAGQTFLLLAFEYGHVEVVKKLLEHGAVIDRWEPDGCGMLSKAAQSGNLEMMRTMLLHMPTQPPFSGRSAFPLGRDDDVVSALYIAAQRGHLEMVRMLFDETPAITYSLLQMLRAEDLAQAAGQGVAARLLSSLAPVVSLVRAVAGVDQFSTDLDILLDSTPDVNAKLGKERMNPLLAMFEGARERNVLSPGSRAADIGRYERVGERLLRAGVDATVRNGNGESVLKLATMSLAYRLANKIVQSGQCEESAGEDVRDALLNNEPRHFIGNVYSIEFTRNLSVLDWLVFSEPVSAQAKHYLKLKIHRLWPQDINNVDQRREAMRLAAENGCAGVILALGSEEDPEFIRDLMRLAAQSGSWNVMKALCKAGGEYIVDNNIMRTALRTAVEHKNHAAVDDIFRLNELLIDSPRAVSRKLTKEDIATAFKMLLVEGETSTFSKFSTDFHMLERLFKSAPRALLPTDGWPQGPAQPLAQNALQRHHAWTTFDYIWCAQGVSQEAKGRLQAHGLWPLDEENGAQIIFAMEAAVRSGCPHIYLKLRELPALAPWRQSEDNAAAFSAMTQRAVLDAAERSNHSMFELLQSTLE